ncbi:phosphoribosylformylglycinamidine synthase [Balneicella halophila]|uniref:Phosphoribosylformylglycinamidine synthase n=1 Tax=Balneicella halophila TaxID=1537566 RepID=A0A7L4URH5_BALHA|nr:phosphoribosylformylglycinamidine synthase [Balneicella halophila]PVX52378.1 phosphoribosylformylglycinamidine synthase [Balneicella halophila]
MNVRVFIEKRPDFAIESQKLYEELSAFSSIKELKVYTIYDLFETTKQEAEGIVQRVLADNVTDIIHWEQPQAEHAFAIESLPGQYDQRADSALQCARLIYPQTQVQITSGQLLTFAGVAENELSKIKDFCINTVESREKDLNELSLQKAKQPDAVKDLDDFIELSEDEIKSYTKENGLAMGADDLLFIQDFFKKEQRNPTETELAVLDTYWSDHCRHTTFETELSEIQISGQFEKTIQSILERYLEMRKFLGREQRPVTLMDLAVIVAKYLHKEGKLDDLVISDEINACTIEVPVKVDGKDEEWLLLFKNETHNHPTEIEPFGGASTCIGGAIRDPLSGRAFVYQAMRVTGAANVKEPISETLEGKLPQKKITKEAAHGYSSYGNQIGLATTHISEVYDEGYKAKRMEVGMVVGAVPKDWVRREKPEAGDKIILLGGKTGRDGCGGATGSSKEHNADAIKEMSTEVQKGNAVEERKIQRFFRNKTVTQLIKKCNDFGAGGVSVAIGELADGLDIDLDKVPVKYKGLNGTELAISESQERMAVVVEDANVKSFIELATKENLQATVVAEVTDTNHLRMYWKGDKIVDLNRDFLDTNGIHKKAQARIDSPEYPNPLEKVPEFNEENIKKHFESLNGGSQKGLSLLFDSSIGTSTVLMPYGGRYQETPAEGSVQKLPMTGKSKTNTVSIASWGFHPEISKWSTVHGGAYAVVESIAKVVAMGGDYKKIRFSFQEYFRKLGNDPKNWGLPLGSLLGAFAMQDGFELAAIGGKDSMSGTFHDLHVPPTLISFAVATEDVKNVVSSEFKAPDEYIYLLSHEAKEDFMPDVEQLEQNFELITDLAHQGKITAAMTVKDGGVASTLAKMSFGNRIGFEVNENGASLQLAIGSVVISSKEKLDDKSLIYLGKTTDSSKLIFNNEEMSRCPLMHSYQRTFDDVFPRKTNEKGLVNFPVSDKKLNFHPSKVATPKVCIPVFPGTNCEYDTQRAFEREGATTEFVVFNNQSPQAIEESLVALENSLESSQILMLSGGFSAGDEPDGSAKYIVSILRSQRIATAIQRFLEKDGLILGICNGFQALMKSGLLPYGDMRTLTQDSPTLTFNSMGQHLSMMSDVEIASVASPWLYNDKVGDIYTIPISHGEGRFYANDKVLNDLYDEGQVGTRYVDENGKATMKSPYNPNGSVGAIEGIISPCGKIYGRMGHPERYEEGLFKNIPTAKYHNIFKSGVDALK